MKNLSETENAKKLLEYVGKDINPAQLVKHGKAYTPALPMSSELSTTEYAITVTLIKAERIGGFFMYDELNEGL